MSTYSPNAQAGHKYLLGYKLSVIIYDYTVVFCDQYINRYSRTHDQMVQAARSGMQNIAEGSKQQSLKSYIKLAGVSRGSLEELLNDYEAYARQQDLTLWNREKSVGEISKIGEIWELIKASPTLPDHPNLPPLPDNVERTVNLMVTLIHQTNYLLDRLIASLTEKHRREGGFTEKLYYERKKYRGY